MGLQKALHYFRNIQKMYIHIFEIFILDIPTFKLLICIKALIIFFLSAFRTIGGKMGISYVFEFYGNCLK